MELRSEAVIKMCSVKKLFLKISKYSQEHICARVKRVWYRRFPVNFPNFQESIFCRTSVNAHLCEMKQ